MKQKLGPLQEEWLRCLESGEFEQTRCCLFRLNPKTGFYANCCLGVGCLVAEANGALFDFVEEDGGLGATVNGSVGYIPQVVLEMLKFRGLEGRSFGDPRESLVALNDSGKTFTEIAEIVRKDPSEYFTEPA